MEGMRKGDKRRKRPKPEAEPEKEPDALERAFRRWAGPALVAIAATVGTLLTVAPEGWNRDAAWDDGPGITCDELYHAGYGKQMLWALRQQGLAFFAPRNIERNFPWRPDGPPAHPPLGNLVLGLVHHLFDLEPDRPEIVSIVPARFAPALAFGLLVLLVGLWTTRAEGPVAGSIAALGVLLVPRMFGHAHLAALDMLTTLFFVAAVLAVLEADRRGGGWRRFALAGAVWGLAMLVRMHGLLLLLPVAAWLVWRLRRRVAVPLIAWLAAGIATFFAGWPWLWISPIGHLRQYLGTATGRQPIHVFYLGRVWDDVNVPWHYPLVMFLVTVPLGLLLLGGLGAWAKRRAAKSEPGYLLVAGTLVFVLLVFALPGAPVYDGVRLFLMVFPLWAILAAAGAKWAIEHQAWRRVGYGLRVAAVVLFVVLQGVGLLMYHPCQLSHYNLAVGGLWGAERLGFEVNYWGDAVPEWLLAEAARRARGELIVFGPNLAPFQAVAVASSSPALRKHGVALVGWQRERTRPSPFCRYGVFYHRKADLPAVPKELWARGAVVEHRKQGVWVARLVELPGPWVLGGAGRGPAGGPSTGPAPGLQ